MRNRAVSARANADPEARDARIAPASVAELAHTSFFPEPFLNKTPVLSAWASAGMWLLLPLAMARVLCFILASMLVMCWTLVTTEFFGLSLERGRDARDFLFWNSPIRWACRAGMLCFGVLWVEEEYPMGTPASALTRDPCCSPRFLRRATETAPIIVANHTSFMDALYIGARVLPVTVGKSGIMRIPFIGRVFRAIRPILVPRSAAERAALPSVAEAIVTRARAGLPGSGLPGPRSQPLIVFPEGTTTASGHVIAFQRGAFLPGVPVQPLAIDYPGPVDVSIPPHLPNYVVLARMLCSPRTRMRVRYLPVYVPSPAEVADPQLFAENVRLAICTALGAVPAPHTDRDAMVLQAAIAVDADFAPYASRSLFPQALTADVVTALRLPPRTPASAFVMFLRVFATYDAAGEGCLRRAGADAWAAERLLPTARREHATPPRRLNEPPRHASVADACPALPPGYADTLFDAMLAAAGPKGTSTAASSDFTDRALTFSGVITVLAIARFGYVATAIEALSPRTADFDANSVVTKQQLALAVAVFSMFILGTADLRVVNAVCGGFSQGGAGAEPQSSLEQATDAGALALTGDALERMRLAAWDSEGAVSNQALCRTVRRVVLAASDILDESWGIKFK